MERIQIKGFKSIKELDLELKPINILIGANGSGKSNFLSFFDFLKNSLHQDLKQYIALKGANKFLHKGIKNTEDISTKLFLKYDLIYSFTLKKGNDNFVYVKEVIGNKNPDIENEIETFGYESNVMDSDYKIASQICFNLADIEKYHFHDTGSNSPFNQESNIENDKYNLYEKGNNLASFLYKIKNENPQTYNIIVKTIQSIAPYFSDFVFKPNPLGLIKLLWQSKFDENIYGATDLSDGTIRFIALTTIFLQPNLPGTIIIDEPELGLHPASIAKLSGMIKSASAKDCQVIIATQSTDLISYFQPEDIITVDQVNGESKFTRLESEKLKQWLEDFTIADLWKRGIISTGQLNF